MIETLDIKGFKSIRNLHLDCRRINLFIGEPNTGKSNILEALGFLSWCEYGDDLEEYVRLERTQNLFHDGLVEKDAWRLSIRGRCALDVTAAYADGKYHFTDPTRGVLAQIDNRGHFKQTRRYVSHELKFLRFYRFKVLEKADSDELGGLLPPAGRNLVALVFSSRELRHTVAALFEPYGLQLVVKPDDHKFEVQKQSEGVAISFPYNLTSDTLQRMAFFSVAIESNRACTLVFEEPEAHAFPYFTKHLGERIALDEGQNQYFIATHNPYLLEAVVEKAPAADVAVFAAYYRDYETHVKALNESEMKRLFEADPFLSIEHVLEEGR